MDTLEGSMQALVTGGKCEEDGCIERARWYVSRGSDSFHWCSMHTVTSMEERDFWKQSRVLLSHVKQ